MRGTPRHQSPSSSSSAKPGSSSSSSTLVVTGLHRRSNDTGGGGDRAAAGPTPPSATPKETDDASSDWPTANGIPVVLLWLPYTALTALLLGLMLASFIRFHRKRLRKFRSRKEQLWRQLDVQEFLEEQRLEEQQQQQQERLPPNGNLLPPAILPPPAPPPRAPSPRQNRRQAAGNGRRNTSLEALHAHPSSDRDRQVATPPTSCRSVVTRQVSRGAAGGEHHRTSDQETTSRRKRSPMTSVTEVTRDRHEHARRAAPAGTGNAPRKRNSVVFITNINGSMVNLRCGEPDALDPFQGRRCFWAVGDRRPSTACPPVSTLVEPPCLRHSDTRHPSTRNSDTRNSGTRNLGSHNPGTQNSGNRPAIWTTAFSYDPDMEYECRKTRYYD